MSVAHVVAVSQNNVIGSGGNLPWHHPEDLKRFKETTMGGVLIMGRKTFASIGRLLPGRTTVVLTRDPNFSFEGAFVARCVEDALDLADELKKNDRSSGTFIVGGGEIYRQTLDRIDEVFLTRVEDRVDGDTFYPEISENNFELLEQKTLNENLTFLHYRKV